MQVFLLELFHFSAGALDLHYSNNEVFDYLIANTGCLQLNSKRSVL
jgi:hypothetical protein